MKKKCCISIEESLWDLAGEKLDSRSEWFEEQLNLYLNTQDKESELLDTISKLKRELNVAESSLCKLRSQKEEEIKEGILFDECMVPLERIYNNLGFIGRNQIIRIANNFNVPSRALESHVKDLGWVVKNYGDVGVKETRMKN